MDYISIWQDYFYEATGTTELTYSLYDSNDELLYMGKAVARPDYGYVRINLSRLVQNYLNSELPDVAFSGASFNAGTMVLPNALRRFYLTDDKGNELGQYYFINIWDYKSMFQTFEEVDFNLSEPINGHNVLGMFTFSSIYDHNNRTVKTTIGYGSNNRGETPSGDTPSIMTSSYCGEGALYYSNAKGGWDYFLIEGLITKKDSYEKYTINNNWETRTLQSGTRALNNTITESWVIKTQLLTDSQMDNMARNLFGSNNIYFHSFKENKIVPVKITDNNVEYKTRKSNKNKVFYATINIESNQPKQRI